MMARAGEVSVEQAALDVRWMDASGAPMGDGVPLAIHLPEDPWTRASESPRRFRLEVIAPPGRPSVRVSLRVRHPGGSGYAVEGIELSPGPGGRLVSRWFVAVSDPEDLLLAGPGEDAILVGLGDAVEARVRRGGGRAVVSERIVGGAGGRADPLSVLRLDLAIKVLRVAPGGRPVVGGDEEGAVALAVHQLRIAGQVLARCHIAIGDPGPGAVELVDPPGPGLIVVGDEHGLTSAGGVVRLTVDGARHGPWKIGGGYSPEEAARLLARRIEEAGFTARMAVEAASPRDAGAAADVLVTRPDGTLATLGRWEDQPLSTDPRQSMTIASVDLADGLDSYDDNRRSSGTVEERALIRGLRGGDAPGPTVFVVNRFSNRARQGESFAASPGSPLRDTVILDWRAVARGRQAHALAHELGHVLLQDPGHPDAGPGDRPWLLMHSSASSAFGGPRLVSPEQCARMRRYPGLERIDQLEGER